MNKLWTAACAIALLTGCGSGPVRQSQTDIEQRQALEQQRAAEQARIREEQEALERLRQEQRRRDEARHSATPDAQPTVRPAPESTMDEAALSNPQSMLDDPNSLLSKRSIYYDYDAYSIKEEYQPLVEAHSRFLLEHKDYKVRIEGHCDERGSREYNLALGQRRADSVKRALNLLGVPAAQIETVSLGSEKPKATGHDEQSWTENRRSDLVYAPENVYQ
jgi:peptidoglycan-associated lipoprotein